MTQHTSNRTRVFISYSHHDADWLARLRVHLKPLERDHRLEIWDDSKIRTGSRWRHEIADAISAAKVAVLLISADFLASDFITTDELPALLRAAEEEGAVIFPLILSPSRFLKHKLLCEFQTVNDPSKPVIGMSKSEQEAVFVKLTEDVEMLLNQSMTPTIDTPKPTETGLERESPYEIQTSEVSVYLERKADKAFNELINYRKGLLFIKGARQTGKTSLLANGIKKARQANITVISTDLQKFNDSQLESLNDFYLTIAEDIADQLHLEVWPRDVWKSRPSPNMCFQSYIARAVLDSYPGPFIWVIDEADRLFSYAYRNEVFSLFRTFYNRGAFDSSWRRLSLVFAFTQEPHLFLNPKPQTSPFNIGTQVFLTDFSLHEVAELNHRYGSPLKTEGELNRFYRLIGGNPYLIHQGFDEITIHRTNLEYLEAEAARDDGLFGNHLFQMLAVIKQDPEMLDTVRKMLQGHSSATSETFYRLRSAGVVLGDSWESLSFRSPIYAEFLKRHILLA